MQRPLRIGTRGSKLALVQAEMVAEALAHAHGWPKKMTEIVVISTKGDRITDRPLSEIGGKGLFTEEIEAGLFSGDIDIAVHSMKDMPTELPSGLVIDCMLKRADVRDAFISPVAKRIQDLPHGARVGSSSLRRQAQIKALRPDLDVVTFRGNVQTRLSKLAAGEVAATFLAMAGLTRLGIAHEATAALSTDDMLPAVGQGAIGIERRLDNQEIEALLRPINDVETLIAVTAERAFLRVLDGSCRTPIVAYAQTDGGFVSLRGMILRPDGSEVHETSRRGYFTEAGSLGADAGRELKEKGGERFFAPV